MTRSTEQVFQEHMKALLNGDFPALLADYADDAVLMTMEGANVGKDAIQAYFINALSALPNAKLSVTGHVVHGDFVLVTWTIVSDVATIPHGVDTFVIHDDKIWLQTIWLEVIPKSAQ
jgi:ketosteroid isomerase-like protein